MIPSFAYARPTSMTEALRLLQEPGAVIHAGGSDLLGRLRDGVDEVPTTVVSLSQLRELKGVRVRSDGSCRIGALTPIAELAAGASGAASYPALTEAAAQVASPQLRNQGTLGGNLCQRPRCWYFRGEFHCLRKGGDLCYAYDGENQYHCIFGGDQCFVVHPSDTAPALVALGARVVIQSAKATRELDLEELYVSPSEDPERETRLEQGEVLTEVVLPPVDATHMSSYRKVRTRGVWDFALVGVALVLSRAAGSIDAANVVLSGVAPIPWRSRQTEQALEGRPLNQETIGKAVEAVAEQAEPLAHNQYKVNLLQGLLRQQLEALA